MIASNRRSVIRGLAALPLVAGAVALFQRSSAAIDPADRARRAWTEFSAAMRDLTAEADGWCILGAADRWTPLPGAHSNIGSFLRVAAVHYETEQDPQLSRSLVIERHREITI